MDVTGIRVGNEQSASENHTSVSQPAEPHVEINGATLIFRFTGKSGVSTS